MILTKLKTYGAVLGFSAILATVAIQTTRLHGVQLRLSQAQAALAQEKEASAVALAEAHATARAAEQQMQVSVTEVRKETNEQVRSIAAHRDSLIERVRLAEANAATAMRVYRDSLYSGDGEDPTGDIGGEFLATIGEEDVVEANRADIIRLNLIACYKQYDSIRETLNNQNAIR